MDKNKMVIIALLVIIIALLVGVLVSMPNLGKTDAVETNNATVNETTSPSVTPDSITVELPGCDTKYTKTVGEYTVEAEKWMGGAVGGFEVGVYKNGQLMDRYSYQSRAYFNDGNGWKWSNWDNGEESGETVHKYPVSSGVEIQEVEVRF